MGAAFKEALFAEKCITQYYFWREKKHQYEIGRPQRKTDHQQTRVIDECRGSSLQSAAAVAATSSSDRPSSSSSGDDNKNNDNSNAREGAGDRHPPCSSSSSFSTTTTATSPSSQQSDFVDISRQGRRSFDSVIGYIENNNNNNNMCQNRVMTFDPFLICYCRNMLDDCLSLQYHYDLPKECFDDRYFSSQRQQYNNEKTSHPCSISSVTETVRESSSYDDQHHGFREKDFVRLKL